MNIKKLFTKLLTDCLKHLGIEVTYCNNNKEKISTVKALVKCPDTTYSLGEGETFIQRLALIEIRSRDISVIAVGDYIKIGTEFYKIFEVPLKDSSGKMWKIRAVSS